MPQRNTTTSSRRVCAHLRNRRIRGPALQTDISSGIPGQADIQAVFFDAGFTLVYSEPPLEERCARLARAHGLDITPQAVLPALPHAATLMQRWYKENPDLWSSDVELEKHWRAFYLDIFNRLGAQSAAEACAAAIYAEYNSPGAWQLYPDVLPALHALHRQGYTLGVISDWDTSLPGRVLLPLGVGPYVSFVLASAAMREAKPGSGLYRRALARAGVEAHRAVHVGDSYVNDVLGARAAGIPGVLLDRDRLYNGALDCPRITTLEELPALLSNIPC